MTTLPPNLSPRETKIVEMANEINSLVANNTQSDADLRKIQMNVRRIRAAQGTSSFREENLALFLSEATTAGILHIRTVLGISAPEI